RVVAILLATAVLSGCVERRYTIRTDPPGALAIVNGEEIGPTPVSRSFVYYGDREITLLRDGFETLHVVQPVDAPWWDNLLTEFFTENVVPVTLRDEREFAYRMAPEVQPARNERLDRGEGLRAQAKQPPPPRRGGILGFFGF